MQSQSTCEKLLSCSSGFAVYSSEEKTAGLGGLVMGFSIVCKRQRAMDMLTSTEATEARQWSQTEKVTTTRDLWRVT